MILCKLVLASIKSELDTLGYANYLYVAPQNASYPFVTFFPVSNDIEYTFGEVMENINIQISIFCNGNVVPLLDMAQGIEEVFDEYSTSSGGYVINCTHRTNETGPQFNGKENYWQLDMDLQFKCQRDKV